MQNAVLLPVARIEQTESPEENKIRAKSVPGGLNKVEKTLFKSTRREVCSVLTPGTRTFNHLDDFRGQSESEMRAWAREVGYVTPTSTILLATATAIADWLVTRREGV